LDADGFGIKLLGKPIGSGPLVQSTQVRSFSFRVAHIAMGSEKDLEGSIDEELGKDDVE
jgi:hypothetical protein